jgi:uncharacterized membrane protein
MAEQSDTTGATRGLERFEAFTDAVFAIAITLLIVEIKAPGSMGGPGEPHGLLAALVGQWRQYLALGISFSVIGIYWLHHHFTGLIYAKTDHAFSLINLGFLAAIMFAPYPARVWAEHLGRGGDEAVASTFLVWALAAPAAAWLGKWLYAARGGRLVDPRLEPAYLRRLTQLYAGTVAVHGLAAVLVLFAPRAGVALSLLLTALYLLPPPAPKYRG